MGINSVLYGFILANNSALVLLAFHILVSLSDFECDYINPQDFSRRLSKWLLPEIVSLSIISMLLLFVQRWYLFTFNFILLSFFSYKFYFSNKHSFYDPIQLWQNFKKHCRLSFIRLAFYSIDFLIFLYLFVVSLLSGV